MRYKVGEIEFINYLPLSTGNADFPFEHSLFRACPKDLNNACRRRELDISPISFFAYSDFEDDYNLLPNFCIAGDGEILSVRLFSNFKLSDLRNKKIYFTEQSESSIGAFVSICKFLYGFNPKDNCTKDFESCDAAFLIGDAALSFNSKFKYDYDLGVLWKEAFKTPMVYSAIAIKRNIFDEVKDQLTKYFDSNLEYFNANKIKICEQATRILDSQNFDLKKAIFYYDNLIYKISDQSFKKSRDILHGKFD